MTANTQSNPVYYSLATGQNTSIRTVVLRRRSDHNGFGVYIGEDVPSGLYVVTVERGSPAADANVQPGDRVLAVNGQTVTSMTTRPKDVVVEAATSAHSLTLTIQSTDLFQTLNIPPLSNSSVENKVNHRSNQQQQKPFKQTLNSSTDLEGYIRSLLANENLQIYSSTPSGNNEFILSTDPPTISLESAQPRSTGHSRSTEHKHEGHRRRQHHHHHHHSRQPPSQKRLVTQETQTSVNDNEMKDTPLERQPSLPKPQYPSQLSTGTSQRATSAQHNTGTINQSQEPKPLLIKKESDFTVASSSPPNSPPPPSVTYQKPLPATTAALFSAAPSASPDNARLTSKRETRAPSQHMIDVVEAAVRASRTGEQTKNPERSSGPAQQTAAKQLTASSNTSSSPDSTRAAVTGPSNQLSPPPYAASTNYRSAEPANNQQNTSQGSYNVRNAQENRQQPPPTKPTETNAPPFNQPSGVREVHLKRTPNFQGFGFHLQYNKVYYLVHRVETDSPAEQAGLHTGDVLLRINQQVTERMVHAQFVQIVNASSNVDFLVQPIDEFLRSHPRMERNSKPVPSGTARNDNEKGKSGLSKALEKLKSH